MLRHAVLAGLIAGGCEVHDLGVRRRRPAAWPCAASAAGAIQITASHNPAPWNGLKLFGADGAVLSAAEAAKRSRQLFDAGIFRGAVEQAGQCRRCAGRPTDWHRDRVLQLVDVVQHPRRGSSASSSTPTAAPAARSAGVCWTPSNAGRSVVAASRRLSSPTARADRRESREIVPAGAASRKPTSASSSTPTPTGWPSSTRRAATSARS